MRNDGAWGFAQWRRLPVGSSFRLTVGDLDLDGLLDVVVPQFNDGRVDIFLGDAGDGLRPHASVPDGGGPSEAAVVDIDGDPFPDLAVIGMGRPRVVMLENDGRGRFEDCGAVEVGAGPLSIRTSWIGGAQALVVASYDGQSVSVLLQDPAGSWREVRVPLSCRPRVADVRDVDADGAADLLVLCESMLVVKPGDGAGGFLEGREVDLDARTSDMEIADLDGDAAPDLAIVDYRYGRLRVHRASCEP